MMTVFRKRAHFVYLWVFITLAKFPWICWKWGLLHSKDSHPSHKNRDACWVVLVNTCSKSWVGTWTEQFLVQAGINQTIMAVCLVRPSNDASIQAHLNHFLRFAVESASKIGAHHQLLVESLQYLLSLALKPLYKTRIENALNKVSNAVPTEQSGSTVLKILDTLSDLYRDLLDKVTQCTDSTWTVPPVNSNPSSALIRINHLWQETLDQIRFDSVWDLSPNWTVWFPVALHNLNGTYLPLLL